MEQVLNPKSLLSGHPQPKHVINVEINTKEQYGEGQLENKQKILSPSDYKKFNKKHQGCFEAEESRNTSNRK